MLKKLKYGWSADEVATDEVATTEPVAYEAWKKICAVNGVEVKKPCPEGCTVEYTESDEPDEAYFIEDHVGCYPLKSGGWAVIHQRIEAAESTPGFYAYDSYKFDGEKLTEADYLVIPPVNEFLDAQKCVGHEETAAQIKKNYSSRPKDFLTYWMNAKEKTIEINLRPLDYESEESTGNFSEAANSLISILGFQQPILDLVGYDGKNGNYLISLLLSALIMIACIVLNQLILKICPELLGKRR